MNEPLEDEIWKDVIGYEGMYLVSNLGKVKTLHKRYYGNVLSPSFERFGYAKVVLMKDGNKKTHKVHRLVAIAFIPNPLNKPVVNHIDHNPKNPKASNLEWCTDLENVRHSYSKSKYMRTNSEYKGLLVFQYDLNGTLIKIWPSIDEIVKEGIASKSGICKTLYGERKKSFGFVWKRMPDYDIKSQL